MSEVLDYKTMKAFIIALSKQSSPLDLELQTEINSIGKKITEDPSLLDNPQILVTDLLEKYPSLKQPYKTA